MSGHTKFVLAALMTTAVLAFGWLWVLWSAPRGATIATEGATWTLSEVELSNHEGKWRYAADVHPRQVTKPFTYSIGQLAFDVCEGIWRNSKAAPRITPLDELFRASLNIFDQNGTPIAKSAIPIPVVDGKCKFVTSSKLNAAYPGVLGDWFLDGWEFKKTTSDNASLSITAVLKPLDWRGRSAREYTKITDFAKACRLVMGDLRNGDAADGTAILGAIGEKGENRIAIKVMYPKTLGLFGTYQISDWMSVGGDALCHLDEGQS